MPDVEAVEVGTPSGRVYYVYADSRSPSGFRISAPADYTQEELEMVRHAARQAYSQVPLPGVTTQS